MQSIVSDQYDGKQRTLYKTSCGACRKEIWLPKHLLKKTRYCSPDCSQAAQRKQVKVRCAWCDTEFSARKSRRSKSKSGLSFCSRKCKDTAQSLEGLSELHPSHYGSWSHKSTSYRKRAFRLFGPQCAECGYDEHKEMLDVHHKNKNRKNHSVQNLEVLCVWCHRCKTAGIQLHPWVGRLRGRSSVGRAQSSQG